MAKHVLVDLDLRGNTIKNYPLNRVTESDLRNLDGRFVGELLNLADGSVVFIANDNGKAVLKLATQKDIDDLRGGFSASDASIAELGNRVQTLEDRPVIDELSPEDVVNKIKSATEKIRSIDVQGLEDTIQRIDSAINALESNLNIAKSDNSRFLQDAKAYADTIKTQLLNSAGADFDTFKEIEDFIKKNRDDIRALGSVTNKFVEVIGDDINTDYVVTHNLGTRSVSVSTRSALAPYEEVVASVTIVDENSIKISTAKPIGQATQIEVMVVG
ncbi:TPA: hypothetical protein ACGO1T_000559 [Streptococcus suis]